MIKLTEEMRECINSALANGTPCILATASPKGEPGISYRGSVLALDDDHLAYWDRTQRLGLEHVDANPKVVVMYRDPKARRSWKFYGDAVVYRSGPIRDQVMGRVVQPELDRDPERKGYAVLVRLNRITDLGGKVLQERG